jgi:hypothetical protein
MGVVLRCCLVLAQKVEQSAHLPRGLFRPPACLVRKEASTNACVSSRARWKLRQS